MSDWRRRYEEHLYAALTGGEDPARALARAADDDELPPGLRAALARADANGVRMSALLVVELRFERVLNGSRRAGEWFLTDPAAFAAAFRRYVRAVPPRSTHPRREGAAFDAWAQTDEGRTQTARHAILSSTCESES